MKIISIIFLFFMACQLAAQNFAVDINPNVRHRIGGIDHFEREKFITIHADIDDGDWERGTNAVGDLADDFLNGYDVYLGRNTGGISWILSQVREDPDRPGFADADHLEQLGDYWRGVYSNKTQFHQYEARADMIIGGQLHPFWPDGTLTGQGWALSQEEPLGIATGEYMGRYLENFFDGNGKPMPSFIEVINEPLWTLTTNGNTPPADVFRFHNTVADQIRAFVPDVLIGGYTAAFTRFDDDNFKRWEQRWKLFIDMCGENMDFYSLHIYDWPSINGGKKIYQKGSNIEATLDMLEQYSVMKLGSPKPYIISEYGAMAHDYLNKKWTPYRDWLQVKSITPLMMQFLERPQLMLKTIPFIMLKATWAGENPPYNHRLMRRAKEMPGETGDEWVYTDMVRFYQLWSDVHGTRVDTYPTNPDILADAWVDGSDMYLALCNLNFESTKVDLNLFEDHGNSVQNVQVKHLYLKGSASFIEETTLNGAPENFELAPEGAAILHYTFANPVIIDQTSDEVKYYAEEYLQKISTNTANTFHINGVQKSEHGEAVLRMGIGRYHSRSKTPVVIFNGVQLAVPENFRGDLQKDRERFFGVIEIPVPFDALQENNEISITFPDNLGYISTVTMQVWNFSKELPRSSGPVTGVQSEQEKVESFALTAYPNPFNPSTTISFTIPVDDHISLDVLNTLGQRVAVLVEDDVAAGTHDYVWHAADQPSGLYFYRLHSSRFSQTGKLLLVR